MADIAVIVLAAGKGTRMKSSQPKVMHQLAGEPMITHVVRAAAALGPVHMVVVVAPGMDQVWETANAVFPGCGVALQHEQKGTGHAVACGMEALKDFSGDVLVVYADTPLITTATLDELILRKHAGGACVALLGMEPVDPTGYGRLVMPEIPDVERIVECKDASPEHKRISWVWGGVMAFDATFLRKGLAALTPSPATGEYYLTELVTMATEQSLRSLMVPVSVEEVMGVNSRPQLAAAEAALQQRLRAHAMESGATLVAPETVFLSADTVIGQDTVVQPYVVFGLNVQVGEGCVIGPFARLRPGTRLAPGAHIGNFVEIKNALIGEGAKVNHLSYVGDASVGMGANVGAGTITCNYDGFAKHKTVIGVGAFIGSNTSLVAPVTIGEGAIVGAGSVITKDVPADALALERGEQTLKPGGALRAREKKAKR